MRNAPLRAGEIDASAIQLFTKQPNRWAERTLDPDDAAAFRTGVAAQKIGFVCAHDSYLINLATPDRVLRERSYLAFRGELLRARELGLDAVVTHPGNATDGDRVRGLAQNAGLIERALAEVGGEPRVLLETTAGSGHALGCTFEELTELIERVATPHRERLGVCFDTCHAFAAGYDLREDFQGVFDRFEEVIGLECLQLFHLNDSQHPLNSRRDRHAHIGEGTLGEAPFRRIMTDPRFGVVPKVLETPKGDDPVAADRRNLGRLRSYAEDPAAESGGPHAVTTGTGGTRGALHE